MTNTNHQPIRSTTSDYETLQEHGPGCDGALNCVCSDITIDTLLGGVHRATCYACGWEGLLRRTYKMAAADGNDHECPDSLGGDHVDVCPTHGEQPVIGYGSTSGPDPYAINELACGHSVLCMGSGEPNTIVGTRS